jgi:hypothetical protein
MNEVSILQTGVEKNLEIKIHGVFDFLIHRSPIARE